MTIEEIDDAHYKRKPLYLIVDEPDDSVNYRITNVEPSDGNNVLVTYNNGENHEEVHIDKVHIFGTGFRR